MEEREAMTLRLGDVLHAVRNTAVRDKTQTLAVREGDAVEFCYWPDGRAFHTMAVRLRERDGNPVVYMATEALRHANGPSKAPSE